MKARIAILTLAMLSIAGCHCPERAVLRESMDQSTRTIRQTQKDWSANLVAYPVGVTDPRTGLPSTGKDMREKLPTLTPDQYNQMLRTHEEYEGLVQEDRDRDSKSPFGGGN